MILLELTFINSFGELCNVLYTVWCMLYNLCVFGWSGIYLKISFWDFWSKFRSQNKKNDPIHIDISHTYMHIYIYIYIYIYIINED